MVLFVYAGTMDLKEKSNWEKFQEYKRLEKELSEMDRTISLKERFHSLSYAVMKVRAKNILRDLKIID